MDMANTATPGGGEEGGANGRFDQLYAELHRLARRELHRLGRIGNLGATTLLHETYLQISMRERTVFVDDARFMGYAARVMRGLIIDEFRRCRSHKRGGRFHITSLHTGMDAAAEPQMLERIGDAIDQLAKAEPGLAEIVDLKFFCGFSFAEIAAMRRVSERTIQRGWEKGRLYLYHAIGGRPVA
jgi:RNA polymerase sigma factor (TIGR02999 family)